MARGAYGSKRVVLLDELRGLAVLCMVVYHALYTLGTLLDYSPALRLMYFFMPAQPFFASLFIFLSGISSRLSHSNFKRGFKLLAVAVALSVVTIFILPLFSLYGCEIYFGVLSLLSVCILLFALVHSPLAKIPVFLGIMLFLFLFFLTYNIGNGYIGISRFRYYLPAGVWNLPDWLMFTGLPTDVYSADYFPLMPWMFMFFAGTYFGIWVSRGALPRFCYRSCIIPLQWLGRHALIVYILHQPVIYLLAVSVQYLLSLL